MLLLRCVPRRENECGPNDSFQCPHDGACPLYHPGYGKLQCSFTQRMQRPEFVRKTKHSGTGHENMDYSYVVIRRGPRPNPATTKVGRIGDVGRREVAKQEQESRTELLLDGDQRPPSQLLDMDQTSSIDGAVSHTDGRITALDPDETAAALRHEAYSWPRLVFPPLKRSGHIILDGCTAEGENLTSHYDTLLIVVTFLSCLGQIMRMTIPKSQGKQPFYDARKSNWGDIFPHEPKNPPQVRHQPSRPGHTPTQGQDIGKRRHMRPSGKKASYGQLAEDIKESRRDQRRARRIADAYNE